MGGCRCVYRKCTNSTSVSPGLHYFHFPVRDPQRCELWIINSHKPEFRALDKDKLRNKVVCSLHFEEYCFTNIKHDRLIHNAVPTLGFEDEPAPIEADPIKTDDLEKDDDFMLVPIDDKNTKFAIPNPEFNGMSYTIFDDAVIPTSKIEEVIIKELENNTSTKFKEVHIKNVVKKIKTKLPELKRAPIPNSVNKKQDISQFSVFNKQNEEKRKDVRLVNTIDRNNDNIPSYSVSTLNGDVSVEPSTHILPDIIQENQPTEFQTEPQPNIESNTNQSLEDISLQFRNENEYTITPVSLIKNMNNENTEERDTKPEIIFEQTPGEDARTTETQQTIEIEENEEQMKTDYVNMIRNNTRQIKHLKQMVRQQHRFNKMVWQRKKMPHFKKIFNRHQILESLKNHVKPSLLAILKLELLPVEEVILNDQEEKFIIDLYTENSDVYNLLRTKYKWKLPSANSMEESSDMQCD